MDRNGSAKWSLMGEPATDAEHHALERVRALLPDDGIAHAWANLTAIDRQGRTDEIDLLLLCRRGLFVVELKGWHGAISGGQQTWRVRSHDKQRVRTEQNPLLLTDAKARRLAGVLKQAARGRLAKYLPFIDGLVVLHGQDSHVDLDELGRTRVLSLDGYSVKGLGKEHTFGKFVQTEPEDDRHLIDSNRAKFIRTIIDDAGMRPTPKRRMVGQYEIDRTSALSEGPNWQDLVVQNPGLSKVRRRIRLFDISPDMPAQQRQEVDQAAKRAFTLTQGLKHPGIDRPIDYFDTDSGPALLYEFDPDAVPLPFFLDEHSLTLDERMDLIRQIGEVLVYAHERRLAHRGLTPYQVYVSVINKRFTVKIRDWHTARRSRSDTETTATATVLSRGADDPRALISQRGWIYLAPESHPVAGSDEVTDLPALPLDIYGFGCLAYLILSGSPPANNLSELSQRLSAGGLNPQDHEASLTDNFAEVIMSATAANPDDRTVSVQEVLDQFELAQRDLNTSQIQESTPDPLDASEGHVIADRFIVQSRRGSGSTGVALAVTDYGISEQDPSNAILKIANGDDAERRLDAEATVLATLDSSRIVRLRDGPIEVDGRQALVLSDAGKQTLAARLNNDGRATLEQLERFGADLFEAVSHLADRGVFHRDIKPANLGVGSDPSTRSPRLVLFDFSLAREPLDHVTSGTRRYLDPYLQLSNRGQYDTAAELYAVAVTLFEMATNETPWWHDGNLAPASAADPVVLTEAMFEESVAAELMSFFSRALAPDQTQRFGTVEEMATAWSQVFTTLSKHTSSVSEDLDADAEAATMDTALTMAGLSPQALSALQRVEVATVGDLLAVSPMRINSIPGLGERHRREIKSRVREWRRRLSSSTDITTTSSDVADRSVEAVLARLVPRLTRSNADKVACLRVMFGISASPSGAQTLPTDFNNVALEPLWPTMNDIATGAGVAAVNASKLISDAATRWASKLAAPEEELVRWLDRSGGVATLEQAAHLVLSLHGSRSEGPARVRLAANLVRSVYEYEARKQDPVLAIRRRRSDGLVLLALEPQTREIKNQPATNELLDYALRLGDKADSLVATKSVIGSGRARSALQSVPVAGITLGTEQLLRLAAGASREAALSGPGELYKRAMSGEDAVRAVLSSHRMRDIQAQMLRRRTRERFPAAQQPPEGPALDAVVRQQFPDVTRDGDTYTFRRHSHVTGTASKHAIAPTQGPDKTDVLLRESLRSRSSLTLAVRPSRYLATAGVLRQLYNVRRVDVAADFIGALRQTAQDKNVDWQVVRTAGAQPAKSQDGTQLRRLVRLAYEPQWKKLLESREALLLTNVAPLMRYGMSAELSQLLDLGTSRPAARWLLVPRQVTDATPHLDGELVPLGPGGWIDIPDALTNHQTGANSHGEKVLT